MSDVNLWFSKLLVCVCAMIFISSITDSRYQANGREINRSGRWNVRVFLPLKSDSHEIIEQLMKIPGDSSNFYPRKCVFSHTLHNIKINFMWLLIIAQNIETCKDQFNPSIDSIFSCLFYLFKIKLTLQLATSETLCKLCTKTLNVSCILLFVLWKWACLWLIYIADIPLTFVLYHITLISLPDIESYKSFLDSLFKSNASSVTRTNLSILC